jgi:hypothetical protein
MPYVCIFGQSPQTSQEIYDEFHDELINRLMLEVEEFHLDEIMSVQFFPTAMVRNSDSMIRVMIEESRVELNGVVRRQIAQIICDIVLKHYPLANLECKAKFAGREATILVLPEYNPKPYFPRAVA